MSSSFLPVRGLFLGLLSSKTEKSLLFKCFVGFLQKTLEEIGEKESLTKERVRQIESEALGILAQDPKAHLLRDYIFQD
ncbi:hypothetical protein CO038_04395 [Candidatus Pacearchaeota archaeon CG_4_9_14_0_2_um_filter_39_13]|nr:MAG: hypothetical protein CO038_04395 [Candidatus Pacearchaeota archaeon CG_4_9_14_0_2_um_filter_39_13]